MGATDEDPCALRALSLCDGQVLEDPEHALTRCLCWAMREDDAFGDEFSSRLRRRELQMLIERALAT